MSRLPLRLKLTLVFAAAMALVLSGAGFFVHQHVAADLSRALDQELRSRAQDLSPFVLRGSSLRASRSGLLEHGEAFAEVIAADSRVVDSTALIGTLRLIDSRDFGRALQAPVFADRDSAPGLDEPARMLAVPLERDGQTYVLVVGSTRENRAEALRSLATAFFIGGPLALILTSLGGYLLAGAALRPIEAMRRRAAEISSSSLAERLPVPASNDEVARLGETLNAMLVRIEDGIARERNFVTDASHELRTPLALLKTELELALREGRSADELEQAVRSAAAETDRLGRIANDLLLLARSEDGRLPLRTEPIDVGDVLHTVGKRFAPQAEAGARRLSVQADDAPVVVADRLRLEQALGNMVDNALRHGAGEVTITASRRNGSVELHVRDHGPGFQAALLERAFERFSRGHDARSANGSGLGLAIVETVARAHGGSAHAANRAAGGADVWLELPQL
jgi:two-component system, OmpR family, sensor kinase